MKEYKVIVMQVSSIDMKVMARSDKEAERKVKDIVENTDLLTKCAGDEATLIKAFTEGEHNTIACDADCENCPMDDYEECLIDELY